MILLFGGTTEGLQAANLLDAIGLPFLYATKTPARTEPWQYGKPICGPMDEGQMRQLIGKQAIQLIIDAAHPFAERLHHTVSSIANAKLTKAIRYERAEAPKTTHSLVQYVRSYTAAIEKLHGLGTPKLLALSGVQSIAKLAPYWQAHETYFRILDRPESIAIAGQSGFPHGQLVLGYQGKTVDEEVKLINKLGVGAVLAKESGQNGQQTVKVQAAQQAQIPIILIERPSLPVYGLKVKDLPALQQAVLNAIAR